MPDGSEPACRLPEISRAIGSRRISPTSSRVIRPSSASIARGIRISSTNAFARSAGVMP